VSLLTPSWRTVHGSHTGVDRPDPRPALTRSPSSGHGLSPARRLRPRPRVPGPLNVSRSERRAAGDHRAPGTDHAPSERPVNQDRSMARSEQGGLIVSTTRSPHGAPAQHLARGPASFISPPQRRGNTALRVQAHNLPAVVRLLRPTGAPTRVTGVSMGCRAIDVDHILRHRSQAADHPVSRYGH
jgi:hypothetical protein